MSNNVLPPLPGFSRSLDRAPEYKTEVFETQSGKEHAVSWWSTPRRRYHVKWNGLRSNVAAPSPWQAYSEVEVLLKFYDDHLGAYDSFLWVDPYTNAQARVRFEEGSLRFRRLVGKTGATQLWAAEADLLERTV